MLAACLWCALSVAQDARPLAAHVDLRDDLAQHGIDATRAQGARGTCSVFTVCQALEFALNRARGTEQRLSVEFLNWAANQVTGDPRDGDFFHNVIAGFERFGACSEGAMPYRDRFAPDLEPTAAARAEAARARDLPLAVPWIQPWQSGRAGIPAESFARIKATLSNGWPVGAGCAHSRLLVGYRDDAGQPGGGVFETLDSALGGSGEVSYAFVQEQVLDAFWIEACAPAITVHVDPRVELFAIVFRIAGNPEFNMDVAQSPYAHDVDEWFGSFKSHAAVAMAKQLRTQQGIAYNAIPDLAVHLGALPDLVPLMPLDPRPPRLDARWTQSSATSFLAALRALARDSKCTSFFAEHATLYEETAARLESAIAETHIEDWVRGFFGPRASSASFQVIVGLLNGGGNFGCGVSYPDGRLELSPVVGVWQWDEDGMPRFGDEHVPTLVHELTHSFVNPLIERHAESFASAGAALFATVAEVMRSQAYTTWQTMLHESLVRACVVRYLAAHQGDAAARRQESEELSRGFRWVPALAQCLAREYEADRTQYQDLDLFAPRIAAFFDAWASRAPRAVSPSTGR
ncbi:MAG: DUF4932 domain-containing protein [Planctomycetota bacterium]